MNVPAGVPVYILFGHEIDGNQGEPKPLNAFTTHQEAEGVLAMSLARSYEHHLANIAPGGTCSILLNRAKLSADGVPTEGMTTGSFAVVNPGQPRQIWDFRIEHRTALPVLSTEDEDGR